MRGLRGGLVCEKKTSLSSECGIDVDVGRRCGWGKVKINKLLP